MTALLAFDRAAMFSAAELDALKRAGAVAVCGYIVGTPGGSPHIDKAHVDLIRSKGLGFVPNWERSAAYLVSCGKAGGAQAGLEAVVACRALGVPDDGSVAVPFSWDTYIDPSLYPQCGQVADGIINGLGGRYLFTAYGEGGLIAYFIKTGRIKPGVEGWLSMSEGFPGFNAADPNIAMVQEHHADGTWFSSPVAGTDVDTITDPAGLHAWWPPNSPYGGDMPLTAADATLVWTAPVHSSIAQSSPHPAEDALIGAWQAGTQNAAAIAALAAKVDALAAAVAKMQTGGVDPVALAQQLVAHMGIDVTAKP